MPSPPGTKTNQSTITIGLSFLAIGLVIIVAVLGVWALAAYRTPVITPVIIEQVKSQAPPAQPTPIQATIMTPTPENEAIAEQMPILLPESPIQIRRLPSFASVDEAPTSYNQPITAQPLRLVIPEIGIDADVSRVPLVANELDSSLPRTLEPGNKIVELLLQKSNDRVPQRYQLFRVLCPHLAQHADD